MGCSNKEHPNNCHVKNIIKVDVTKTKKFNPILELNEIKKIPLQTTTDCLIHEISKAYFTNKYIIVFDQHHSNIFQFDNKGNYIRKIGVKGQGPNEYITFNDVVYDFDTGMIYAFERFNSKMHIYNLEGELIKLIDSKFLFNSFIKCKYGYWIYSCFKQNNPNNSLLMLVDENLSEIKQEYLSHKDITSVQFTPRFTFNQTNGKMYFFYDYSDHIWELSDKAEEAFKVDFGGLSLPYQEMKEATEIKKYDKIINSSQYVGFIDNLLISNDFIYFNCRENGLNKSVSQYTVKYDLYDKIVNVYGSTIMSDKVLPASYTKPLCLIEGNTFVYVIEPQTMFNHEFNKLKSMINDVSEDDNPILVFMEALPLNNKSDSE